MELSENERRVLKNLLQNSRAQDAEVARRLGITAQAVRKIRKKLEEMKVIKGYTTLVDYEKLGINILAIAHFRIKSRAEEALIRWKIESPYLINFYRLLEGDITHIAIYGFQSLREMDQYFHMIQSEGGHVSELARVHVLPVDSILKESPNELIAKLLDEKGVLARPIPPSMPR
jgi:DNA-binding Lrp family transcriptional regulator